MAILVNTYTMVISVGNTIMLNLLVGSQECSQVWRRQQTYLHRDQCVVLQELCTASIGRFSVRAAYTWSTWLLNEYHILRFGSITVHSFLYKTAGTLHKRVHYQSPPTL